ncbi:hypothetical protein GCM10017710_06220 [Arthrobacter ramosus]
MLLLVVGAADGLEVGGAEDVPAWAGGLAAVTSNTQALRLNATAAVSTIVAIWRKEKIGPTPIDLKHRFCPARPTIPRWWGRQPGGAHM